MSVSDERLENIPNEKIMLREIVHVCVVVRNVEKTAKNLAEKFGIGPYEIRVKHYPTANASLRGQPVDMTLKFGYAKVGPIILELVETLKGKSIYQEFLEKHGEGLHHIGFPTPLPFDAELEKWRSFGIEPLQANRLNDPEEGWAYMDTKGLVGFLIEILSFKKYQ